MGKQVNENIDNIISLTKIFSRTPWRENIGRVVIRCIEAESTFLEKSGTHFKNYIWLRTTGAITELKFARNPDYVFFNTKKRFRRGSFKGLHCESSEPDYLKKEFEILIYAKISELPRKMQSIILLYYYHGVQFDKIALGFEVTPGRISQIHSRAIKILKKKLNNSGYFHDYFRRAKPNIC